MTQYTEGSTRWPHSAAITVDATGWSSGAQYITITVPADFAAFWDGIHQTDARDVRLLDADGVTKLSYQLVDQGGAAVAAADITARDMIIRIGSWTPPSAAMCRIVLAWGASGVSSGGTTVTPSSPLTGYINLGRPRLGWPARRERPDQTQPLLRVHKDAAEAVRFVVDFRGMLASRIFAQGGSPELGQLKSASYVVSTGGSAQAGMISATSVRFADPSAVIVLVQAGTSGTNYTVVVTAVTTTGETLISRTVLDVQTLSEQ
jgi:hypothetical protein